MSRAPDARSELRLFLSVDIAGSTALKSQCSYESLKERVALIRRAIGSGKTIPKELLPSKEDYDWAAVQERVFKDFHTDFDSRPPTLAFEREPWKAIGDELVYSFRIVSRDQACALLCAFLSTLRRHDHKLADGHLIRLKGSAWVAGFPVRNRVVHLPTSRSQNAPQVDYWGPDIDIGFRLSRYSFPGMCVASLGLVELFSSHKSAEQVKFAYVGWKRLKGVWEDRPYPIFWTELPNVNDDTKLQARVRAWSEAETPFIKVWQNKDSLREAKHWKQKCFEIRKDLPSHLSGVVPYVPGQDPTPEEHAEILALLGEFSSGAAGEQQSPKLPNQTVDLKAFEARLNELLSKFSKPASSPARKRKPNPPKPK